MAVRPGPEDPASSSATFRQALTHLSLISAALNLDRALG
jgi:hypothetical protein